MSKLFELFLSAHKALDRYKVATENQPASLEQLAVLSLSDDDFEYWWHLHDNFEMLINQTPQGRFAYIVSVISRNTFKIEFEDSYAKVSGNIDGKKYSVHVHLDEIIISRNTQCKSKIMEIWETVTSH
jgi:hypothetical protein